MNRRQRSLNFLCPQCGVPRDVEKELEEARARIGELETSRMEESQRKDPLDVLIMEAKVAAGIVWGEGDEKVARGILRRCANVIEGLRREAREYAESLDNIRAALGQEATHHLVMADDIRELVKAIEHDANVGGRRAFGVLHKLRKMNKSCPG